MDRQLRFLTSMLGACFVLLGCGDDDKGGAGDSSDVETSCDDGADNDKDGQSDCNDLDCRIAGTICTLAPPLDRSVASTLAESAKFLYTGPDPLQKGADSKVFDVRRLAMLRGKVVDREGKPLAGVRVSVSGHSAYGYTLSRTDGLFDLAVNGGARV